MLGIFRKIEVSNIWLRLLRDLFFIILKGLFYFCFFDRDRVFVDGLNN